MSGLQGAPGACAHEKKDEGTCLADPSSPWHLPHQSLVCKPGFPITERSTSALAASLLLSH